MNLLDLMVKIGVDDEASDKIGTISSGIKGKLGDAAKTVGKLVAAGTATVAAGAIAITTAATNSYAQFEQLEGGVSKLYGTASDKMKRYAQGAYRTAGMSANQYMEQATSFSAALIKSLGGDVDKAADQTDKAMRLMSDNVNTFGTDAEAVQNAIQGLSRDNFTMLDNLKLGYAGTKEGMQQLIADANEYAGLVGTENELTMDSFSDMIDAIDIIQKKQNIWGTTAKEAATTIEGSVNMTKAAWENFLTSLGTGDEDMIRQSVDGLVDGIFGTFDEKAGKRVGGVIQNVAPVVERVGEAILTEIPSLASTVGTMFVDTVTSTISSMLGESGMDALNGFLEGFLGTFDAEPFTDTLDRLMETGGTLIDMLIENLPTIGALLGTALTVVGDLAQAGATVVGIIGPFLPSILAAFTAIKAVGIGSAAISLIGTIGAAVGSIQTFGGAITALVTLLGGPVTVIAAVVAAIVAFIATNEDARDAIVNAWETIKRLVSEAVENMKTSVSDGMQRLKDSISQKWDEAVEFLQSIPRRASDAVGDLSDTLSNAGYNLISGLLGGIKQKAEDMWTYVSGIADRIAQLKGPLPYDRKVLVGNGVALVSGLLTGIERMFEGEVIPYVSEMAGKMGDAVTSAQAAMPTLGYGYTTEAVSSPSATAYVRDDAVLGVLTAILNAIPQEVTLDSRALVGSLAPDMNRALGAL